MAHLTLAQRNIIKADVLADPVLSALPISSNAVNEIIRVFQLDAVPLFNVWRTSVPVSEIMANGFVWTAVDNLLTGKARIWEWMMSQGSIDASKSNIRQGLVDAFGAGTPMALGIEPHLKRPATRLEKLFATGTGTVVAPGLTVVTGSLGYVEVLSIMGW